MTQGVHIALRKARLVQAVPNAKNNLEGLREALKRLAEKGIKYHIPIGVFKRYYGIDFEPMKLDEIVADMGVFAGKGQASRKRQLVEEELRKEEYWE